MPKQPLLRFQVAQDLINYCMALPYDSNHCQIWDRGKGSDGYGTTRINKRMFRCCRVVLEGKLKRPIKPGYKALHSCDNPACVNQDHLEEGTQKENVQDAVVKGRWITQGYYIRSEESKRKSSEAAKRRWAKCTS
jgi:hypothetical protein